MSVEQLVLEGFADEKLFNKEYNYIIWHTRNQEILNSFFKTRRTIEDYQRPMCSVSGGRAQIACLTWSGAVIRITR